MAAALSMPADHCVRKPVAATMPSTPACHHHDHATTTQSSGTSLTIRSKQCCDGHECCRSMVRSHSAYVGPRTLFQEIDRIDDYVSLQPAPLIKLELAFYRSVRGPPAL
jgi:hypothetical protein